jgi:hypothetical protein
MTGRLLRRLRSETGSTLVFALWVIVILSLTTAGVITASVNNQATTASSSNAKQAFALAETALSYAEGMLYTAAANHTTPPGGAQDIPAQPGGGSGQYWASVAGDGTTWTMYGSATVGGVSRLVHAQAIVPSPVTVSQTGVWNYLYADAGGSACATSINGNVTISVPIMVRGDLCLSGSLDYTGATLTVGGNLSLGGSAKIGSSHTPITSVYVGLDSSSTSTCQSVTPGTGACDGAHNPIYANTVTRGASVTPEMPCIGQPSSWDPGCTDTHDGTWDVLHTAYNTQASATKTGCPANLLDNDSTLNNSDGSISSVMFGGTAYDCKIGTDNEIKWVPSTHTLTVKGQIYFDGSLNISGTVYYTGQASLYFTGSVGTTGSPSFCGVSGTVGGTSCTSAWNPDVDGIIMVAGCWANSTGTSLTTSGCVGLGGNSKVQFGVYATTDYSTSGGSSNMGPVLAHSVTLGGSTQTLKPFTVFPPGTPLNTQTNYLPATSPVNWGG